eukprot:g1075.t1
MEIAVFNGPTPTKPGDIRRSPTLNRPKIPKSPIKLAHTLGMQQLVQKFRLLDVVLPMRLLPSKSPPSRSKTVSIPCQRDKRNQQLTENRIQFGQTISLLREFFPMMLRSEWPEEILAEDVVLLDGISPRFNLAPFKTVGKKAYCDFMWYLRFNTSLICKGSKVEVLRFWQPCKEMIVVRWSIKFRPRLLYRVYGTTVQIDGVSEFKLNQRGQIYQHSVDISDHHNFKFDLQFHSFMKTRCQTLSAVGV